MVMKALSDRRWLFSEQPTARVRIISGDNSSIGHDDDLAADNTGSVSVL